MDKSTKDIIYGQFGAAIVTLRNAIKACQEELWYDNSHKHEFWYMAYHTLFWLDYYLTDSKEEYVPPEPFGLEELDPAGVIPERAYTKEELLKYLDYGYRKCKKTIFAMSDEEAAVQYKFGKGDLSRAELLLYNMRHVQHHAAQLNLMLRLKTDSSPGWVFKGDG